MISYCVTVYNEKEYLKVLLDKLSHVRNSDEEIVVLQTYRNPEEIDTDLYIDIQNLISAYTNIVYDTYHFQNDFASLKNTMGALASKEYIFNLDADEDYPFESFQKIRNLLKEFNNIDLFYLPRINTVKGITPQDINKYSWKLNPLGWINWPDYQPRIYKNKASIQWVGIVHEHLEGFSSRILIDANEELAIIHNKEISRQRAQNTFYSQMLTKE